MTKGIGTKLTKGIKVTKETEVTKGTETKGTKETKVTGVAGGACHFCRFCRFCFLSLFGPFSLFADVVHVYERASTGELLADSTLETGRSYLTSAAPAKSGYIFTGWTISTAQDFEPRDAWGRSFDAATYKLYEETTLIANYLASSVDTDSDGVTDGYEYYWYGDLSKNASSDTDGDGYTFAQEIAKGYNPLFPERHDDGPVAYTDGAEWLYNPNGYAPYTIRSEPEGALFTTVSEYVRPGTTIASYTGNPSSTAFAYWSLNGVRQCDAWGRALDSFSITMPSNAVELVAVANTTVNDKWKLYWYGTLDVEMTSDTDGDGKTFAEEIAAGTNPLMPERHEDGPVTYVDGELWQYNPYNIQPYTIMSDPEGELFATTSVYVRAGSEVTSYTLSPNTSAFAYWVYNGAEQRDAWGRALDTVSFRMPTNAVTLVAKTADSESERQSLYWYGNTTTAMTSDTDGDGKTFAEELAAGTNPLMAERHMEGPVAYVDTDEHELNLQVYEQMQGAVVDGGYSQLFYSSIAGNEGAANFGANVRPVVGDVDGDGLWDLVVVSDTATNVWLNVGSSGNPEFGRAGVPSPADGGGRGATALPWLDMNSTNKLAEMTLDVAPVGALSATTNGATMLVSDEDGRIWYYVLTGEGRPEVGPYQLQHKVWGGSYAGFAAGLQLAAVDWEDDGDLDCLCGTADGRLMLLRDPKVGRPMNVQLYAGVDNVLLAWDPNAQSRIRGYRVYRDGGRLGEPSLPQYRDEGLAAGEYIYEISSMSRFYTAGNSTPTVSESPRTAAVTATIGGVSFFWNDVNVKRGETAEVMLSIENSKGFEITSMTEQVKYDPAYLTPMKVLTTGLTAGFEVEWSATGGVMTVTIGADGGDGGGHGVTALPAGRGRFLIFVFDTVKAGETMVGGAAVTIADSEAKYMLGDVDGDGELTSADLRLMVKLCSVAGRKYTADQLKAGDFNGDGKLTMADYQLMRQCLKEKGEQ